MGNIFKNHRNRATKDNSLKLIFPCFLFELMRYFQIYYCIKRVEICKFKRDDHFSEVGLPSKERSVHRVTRHTAANYVAQQVMRTQIPSEGIEITEQKIGKQAFLISSLKSFCDTKSWEIISRNKGGMIRNNLKGFLLLVSKSSVWLSLI